jgi:hypothetical protein
MKIQALNVIWQAENETQFFVVSRHISNQKNHSSDYKKQSKRSYFAQSSGTIFDKPRKDSSKYLSNLKTGDYTDIASYFRVRIRSIKRHIQSPDVNFF